MAGFLDTLFGGGAEKDAANANRGLYQNYFDNGQSILGQGYNTGVTNLNSATDLYKNLANQYGKGTTLYLDALGINGTDAAKNAQSAFTTSPGYQQGIDAGLDAINRRRAATGMSNSGNADLDALNFAQNNQNQQYNNWLSNLSGVNQNNITATQGEAAGYGSLADLANQNASNQVGLLGNYTSGMTSANNLQAAGEAAGAKNLLGAGLSLATLGMGGGGFGSALGGMGSSLGSSLGSLGLTYGIPGTSTSNLYGPLAPR